MTESAKKQLTEAVKQWLNEPGTERSQGILARRSGVSASIISNVARGLFAIGNSQIGDQHFHKLAEALDIVLEGRAAGLHWNTETFNRINKACKKAQTRAISVCIDGSTGVGKTYGLEYYAKHNDHVLYIKCTQSMKKKDLLDLIVHRLMLRPSEKGEKALMDAVHAKMVGDEKWLIILDETELVKHEIYFAIKEIIDFTRDHAGVVMAGMNILTKLQVMANKDRAGIPKLLRRVAPHAMELSPIQRAELVAIAMSCGVDDKHVLDWLFNMAKDMDALRQYLTDIMDEVKRTSNADSQTMAPVNMDMIRKLFIG